MGAKKKENPNALVKTSDIVCARMSGHRPWPAKVLEFKRNGTLLKFYGTGEIGTVKKSEIVPYKFCPEIIAEYLKVPIHNLCQRTQLYHLSFVKAIREVSCINV